MDAPASNRITRYRILPSGGEEPIVLVVRLLEAAGVEVRRIDRRAGRIAGWLDSGEDGDVPVRVIVRLYPREEATFVESRLEGDGTWEGAHGVAEGAERLTRSLDAGGARQPGPAALRCREV